jgi:hypothetical protein
MKFKHTIPLILAAMLVFLTACGSKAESTEVSAFPTGKFVSANDPAQGYLFSEDGTFGYYFGGAEPVVTGTYTISGDRLSLVDPEETDPQCQGEVTYTWSFDGTNLTFAPTAEDTCKPRSDSFAETFIRAE